MAARPRLKDPDQVARARQRLTPGRAEDAAEAARKAICVPARLQIIQALTAGPLCVDDLAIVIGRTPAATSQHLRVLRDEEIVEGIRRGTTVSYHLRPGSANASVAAVLRTLEHGATPPS